MSKVADAFYSLDMMGYGAIDARSLRIACKAADRPLTSIATIMAWMCSEGPEIISLCRFSDSMAEEVIDGRALRHSFESLDEDLSWFKWFWILDSTSLGVIHLRMMVTSTAHGEDLI